MKGLKKEMKKVKLNETVHGTHSLVNEDPSTNASAVDYLFGRTVSG